jgi:CHAD domain-containing protein
MAYRFGVVQNHLNSPSAAALSVRLLALLQTIPNRAGKKEIHLLRTSVRRLEAQLHAPPASLARAMKQLRRKAGKLRDIDVHLGLLETPPAVKGLPASASHGQWSRLRAELKRQRSRRTEKLRELVAELAPLLQRRLPASAESTSLRPAPQAAAVEQRLDGARRSFLRWVRRVPSDPLRFHQLRIKVKNIRYTLEPLAAASAEAAGLVEQLKRAQDAIGNWHDWATLQALASGVLEGEDGAAACRALEARTTREFRRAQRIVAAAGRALGRGRSAAGVHPNDAAVARKVG